MKKALYFGSFNPVHYGHVAIAMYVASMEEIDSVVIIPSPHNPFKDVSILADPALRLNQVREAFRGIHPKITVSDIEYRLSEPLYTINTMHAIQKGEPDAQLILLIGADNISTLEKWYHGKEILQNFDVWVYPRKGTDGAAVCGLYCTMQDIKGVRFLKDAPLLDISSTEIRNMADNK